MSFENLFNNMFRAILPASKQADWDARCEDDRVDGLASLCARVCYLKAHPYGQEFKVGTFDVTVTDSGWAAQVREQGQLLLDFASDGDHHCTAISKRHFRPDDGWMGRFENAAKIEIAKVKTPSRSNGVTQYL